MGVNGGDTVRVKRPEVGSTSTLVPEERVDVGIMGRRRVGSGGAGRGRGVERGFLRVEATGVLEIEMELSRSRGAIL